MAFVTWRVSVDLNQDGDFADSNEDISTYVTNATWSLGFTNDIDPIAKAASLELVLNNGDKRFSPENASSPLYPNFTLARVIKVEANYSAAWTTMFVGRISSIVPTPGTKQSRDVAVRVDGFEIEMQRTDVEVPIMEDVTADEVIEEIIRGFGSAPPGFEDAWVLGSSGLSLLGQTTKLGDITDILGVETGKSTFEIIGDEWTESTSVYAALMETAGREFGKVYLDRAGRVCFFNRHHFVNDYDADVTVTEDQISSNTMQYDFGIGVINHATVPARVRTIGNSIEPLGTLDKAVPLRQGTTKTINFKFVASADGAKISGKGIVEPVRTTDFQINTVADGTGTDITAFVDAKIVSASSSGCKIEFRNLSLYAQDGFILSGARVRGVKVTDYGLVHMAASDESSIKSYFKQGYSHQYPMDDPDVAEGIASFIVNQNKDPRGHARSVSFQVNRSSVIAGLGINRNIGDRITLSETQTGLSGDYHLLGENWNVPTADPEQTVTWILMPASSVQYWSLGIANLSELGQTTHIGPF